MSISFDGIGEVVATFLVEADCELEPGDVVCLTGDSEVGLGTSGGLFCGVAVTVAEDGYAAVQLDGLAVVRYSGTAAPEVGWAMLAADGAGNVTAVKENGLSYLVLSVDEEAKLAVVKL